MKRTIAAIIPQNTGKIPPNTLGSLNRAWSARADIDTKLSDGTPPTAPVIDLPLLNTGIHVHPAFGTMTYGPAMGFPFAIDAIRTYLEIDRNLPVLLNEGDQIAEKIRTRAEQAIDLVDTPILRFESAQSYRSENPTTITNHLRAGGVIQIKLPDLLPTLEGSDYRAPSLAIEIFGNQELFSQMVIIQGYVGPVLGPVAQAILNTESLPAPSIHLDIPSISTLTGQFVEDVNQNLGTAYKHGVIVPGGCSGALFQTLSVLPASQAIIPQPFFAPQNGIVAAASHFVSIAPNIEDLAINLTDSTYQNGTVLLTMPNNPDGKLISPETIQSILSVARTQNQTLILDATYYNRVQSAHKPAFESVFRAIESSDVPHLVICSGSKARTLTKYRVALIVGSPGLVNWVQQRSDAINGLSALALSAALHPDNKSASETHLNNNVALNREIIQSIMAQTLSPSEVSTLNSGLQKLDILIQSLGDQRNQLSFEPGDGALYALLRVDPQISKAVSAKLNELGLALVPGEIFSGQPVNIEQIQHQPQAYYRISLMANPYAN